MPQLALRIISCVALGISAMAQGQSSWKSHSLPSLALTISLPVKPLPRRMDIKQNDTRIVKSSWYTADSGGIQFALSYTNFKPGSKLDLAEAARGALMGLRQSRAVQDFASNSKAVTVSGVPGIKIFASFRDKGQKVAFEALFLGKGTKLWQAMATYDVEPTYAAIAKRALTSLKVNP